MRLTTAITILGLALLTACGAGTESRISSDIGTAACTDEETFADCSRAQLEAELREAEAELAQEQTKVVALEKKEGDLEQKAPASAEQKAPVAAAPGEGEGEGAEYAPVYEDQGDTFRLVDNSETERLQAEIRKLESEIAILKKEIEILERKIALLKSKLSGTTTVQPVKPLTGQVACIDWEVKRNEPGRPRVVGCVDAAKAQCTFTENKYLAASDARSAIGRTPREDATCATYPRGTLLANGPGSTEIVSPTGPTNPVQPSNNPITGVNGACSCKQENGPWINNSSTIYCVVRNTAGNALSWNHMTPGDNQCVSGCNILKAATQCR